MVTAEPTLNKPSTVSPTIHTSSVTAPATAQSPVNEKEKMTDMLLINHMSVGEKSSSVVTGRVVLVKKNKNSHFNYDQFYLFNGFD